MTTETATKTANVVPYNAEQQLVNRFNSRGLGVTLKKQETPVQRYTVTDADGNDVFIGITSDFTLAVRRALHAASIPIADIATAITRETEMDEEEKRHLQIHGANTNFELYSCFAGECLIESNGDGIRDETPTHALYKCYMDLLEHAEDVKRFLIDRLASEITGYVGKNYPE